MSSLETFAPAKLNLYLHITGRRDNGYHELDSLVVFCDVGDKLRLESADTFSFALEGPLALELSQEPQDNNLVVRAARKLAQVTGNKLDVKLTLVKNLPIASGIGGGSSDAAAALRLLARHWGMSEDDPALYNVARSLGQDIPCCLKSATCFFRGIGDEVSPGPALPTVHCVLVNPRLALPTPSVYKARQGAFVAAAPIEGEVKEVADLIKIVTDRHNGLTDAACSLVPEIKKVLLALEASPNCLVARMSGSGATCFGLYPDRGSAREAVAKLFSANPNWWMVAATMPFSQQEAVLAPQSLTSQEKVA